MGGAGGTRGDPAEYAGGREEAGGAAEGKNKSLRASGRPGGRGGEAAENERLLLSQ